MDYGKVSYFSKRNTFLLWGTVLLLLVLAFAFQPLYTSLKGWRSRSFIKQAQEFLLEGRNTEALSIANSALQLNRSDPNCVRIMARILSLSSETDVRRQALGYWWSLWETEDATAADRELMLKTALRVKHFPTVNRHLTEVLDAGTEDLELLLLAAQFMAQENNLFQSIKLARFIIQKDSLLRPAQLFLAQQLIKTKTEKDFIEARNILWSISRGFDDAGLQALRLLGRKPMLNLMSSKDLRLIIQGFRGHPEGTMDDHFLVLDLNFLLNEENPDEIVSRELRDFIIKNSDDRIRLGRWLVTNRRFKEVIELISMEDAMEYQNLLTILLDAFAGMGQWEDVKRILDTDEIELYLARFAMEFGQKIIAQSHWERVFTLAETKPFTLFYIADYAEKLGLYEYAEQAYEMLTKYNKNVSREAFSNLVRLAEMQKNTARLLQLVKLYGTTFPNDNASMNDWAYLNLLLNQKIQESKSMADNLVAKLPFMHAFRTTLALAYLRLNLEGKAAELYEKVALNWEESLPGWQAVYIAVLGANGDVEQARDLASKVPVDRLKPEELLLIKQWLP